MLILAASLIVLGLIAALAGIFAGKDKGDKPVAPQENCGSCGFDDSRCMHECMLEAAVKPVVYYDDEELDMFRGRASDSYSEQETDLFAEVLHTMRPDEVEGWCRSLELRGVALPDSLKDEVIMIIDDEHS